MCGCIVLVVVPECQPRMVLLEVTMTMPLNHHNNHSMYSKVLVLLLSFTSNYYCCYYHGYYQDSSSASGRNWKILPCLPHWSVWSDPYVSVACGRTVTEIPKFPIHWFSNVSGISPSLPHLIATANCWQKNYGMFTLMPMATKIPHPLSGSVHCSLTISAGSGVLVIDNGHHSVLSLHLSTLLGTNISPTKALFE